MTNHLPARKQVRVMCILAMGIHMVFAAAPSFDAAAVRASGPAPEMIPFDSVKNAMSGGPGTSSPGRITYHGVRLIQVIMKAYNVDAAHISGPDWIKRGDNLFEIVATFPADTTADNFRLMLQNLLAERFGLVVHPAIVKAQGYQLIIAPSGSRLKTSEQAAQKATEATAGSGPANQYRIGADGTIQMKTPGSAVLYWNGAERVAFKERELSSFVSLLGGFINMSAGAPAGSMAPVVADKTGLMGKYDFSLSFACGSCTPPMSQALSSRPAGSQAIAPPADLAPGLFVAIEKQLGLRLEKVSDVPVDIIVVDQVNKQPTDN